MMAKLWAHLIDMVSNQLIEDDQVTCRRKPTGLSEAVEGARQDWLRARAYFDNVTDPDLIDHAIYCIEAAERKYMYLLKQAKVTGFRLDNAISGQAMIHDLPQLEQLH